MDDFASFPPQPQSLEIAGDTLALTPIRVGEVPALLAAIKPIAPHLVNGDPDWLALLTEHGDAILDALAIAARRPREWVEALSLDDAVLLATALFEVNVDFFVQRVVPAIQSAAARIDRNVRAAGMTPSTA
ncbi:MAG TPA: DUF6631 family protein [Gemmatimonadaceae bacterium]|jgi:hypothetical protein